MSEFLDPQAMDKMAQAVNAASGPDSTWVVLRFNDRGDMQVAATLAPSAILELLRQVVENWAPDEVDNRRVPQ